MAEAVPIDCSPSLYTIQYAPGPSEAITQAASSWLGRDLYKDAACERVALPGFSDGALRRLTCTQNHQGFQPGLTEPFELAQGVTEVALRQSVRDFANRHAPFSISLEVEERDQKIVVALQGEVGDMARLQHACQTRFSRLGRLPGSYGTAFARQIRSRRIRRRAGRPVAHFPNGQFVMPLTARIPCVRLRKQVRSYLEEMFVGPLVQLHEFGGIAIGVQDYKDSPFRFIEYFEFGEVVGQHEKNI